MRKLKSFLTGLTLIAATVGFGESAQATIYQYTLTGTTTTSFTIDTEVNIPTAEPSSGAFYFTNIGSYPLLYFYDAPLNGGGMIALSADYSTVFLNISGPQLFDGPLTAPVLKTFSTPIELADWRFGDESAPTFLTVTIAAPVPEPSTWAMMIIGFASVGFMAYRRRQSAARAV